VNQTFDRPDYFYYAILSLINRLMTNNLLSISKNNIFHTFADLLTISSLQKEESGQNKSA